MKSRKARKLIIPVCALVVLFFLYSFLGPPLVIRTAQRSASSALGTDVRIANMSFSLLRGRISVSGISVANIEDFDSPEILTVDEAEISFIPSSAFSDDFKFREVNVSGVNIFLQQKNGRNNLLEFQDRITRQEENEDVIDDDKKHFSAETVKVEEIVMHLDILGDRSTVQLEPVVLENISSREEISMGAVIAGAAGALMARAAGETLDKILSGVITDEHRDRFRGAIEDLGDYLP